MFVAIASIVPVIVVVTVSDVVEVPWAFTTAGPDVNWKPLLGVTVY